MNLQFGQVDVDGSFLFHVASGGAGQPGMKEPLPGGLHQHLIVPTASRPCNAIGQGSHRACPVSRDRDIDSTFQWEACRSICGHL